MLGTIETSRRGGHQLALLAEASQPQEYCSCVSYQVHITTMSTPWRVRRMHKRFDKATPPGSRKQAGTSTGQPWMSPRRTWAQPLVLHFAPPAPLHPGSACWDPRLFLTRQTLAATPATSMPPCPSMQPANTLSTPMTKRHFWASATGMYTILDVKH